jgi:acyl-coenzyme A thioesterase PaaI-like protein
MSLKTAAFKRMLNLWPPLLGAGIRVKKVSDDFTTFDVEMKLRRWNSNREKMHYGGSLYSMTDPFFALILRKNLGKDYFIVDKEAVIHFKKPGRGKVTAHFNIAAEHIAEIKKQADAEFKVEPKFTAKIYDEKGNLVAEVEKTIYIRRRDRKPQHGYNKPK